jgi:perosamine synthetase
MICFGFGFDCGKIKFERFQYEDESSRRKQMIAMANPAVGAEEKAAVMRALDSGMIADGMVVREFESSFAAFIGSKHGIATTSGTTALETALRSLGIGKDDKVITTAFSFIASANSIVYVGATPVFADIDPRTFNITADGICGALDKHPDAKAVLIVHLFGQPCDMDEITALTREKELLLIEDCAQAHGAMWNGQRVGGFGDAAAFSFYPTKNITTGEGGMVLTNHSEAAERARLYINHGMKTRYYHDIVGYNYRMTNIAAAIGLEQLKKLNSFNEKRREYANIYAAKIRNPLIEIPYVQDKAFHVFHQYSIKVKGGRRGGLIKLFEENDIGCGVFYPLTIPEQACYQAFNFQTAWQNANHVKEQILSIPVHPLLENAEIEKVAEVIDILR